MVLVYNRLQTSFSHVNMITIEKSNLIQGYISLLQSSQMSKIPRTHHSQVVFPLRYTGILIPTGHNAIYSTDLRLWDDILIRCVPL